MSIAKPSNRPPRRVLSRAATAASVALLAATVGCWIAGLVREKQSAVLAVHARPDRAFFARIERQHLVLSQQRMVPMGMPEGYTTDCTRFRVYRVYGPLFPDGVGTELSPDYFALNPSGAGFHALSLEPGGVRVMADQSGTLAWRVVSSYGAVEIPWWSLLVLFSTWPAARWVIAWRRRAAAGRGLCPACGYDLRATPDRCPECGAAPGGILHLVLALFAVRT